jgi:hypothetical protein
VIGPGQRPPWLSLSGRRCLDVPQPLEANKLVCEQFALFIAPDKDLEHGAPVDVDELQRTGAASEESTVDKIDRGASRNARVTAEWALSVNVEIAARLAPWRRRRRLEDAVLRMNDERHRPPIDEVGPDVSEARARRRPRCAFRQKIEHDAKRNTVTARRLAVPQAPPGSPRSREPAMPLRGLDLPWESGELF